MRMTGAEMVVKTLEKNGVKVVFGYPGAANCPIIDKLSFSSIKHILTRNEQGAAHMASGYARVTKQAGVCTATSGPGATNLITGIATAYMDSIPMVALTGQVATKLIGKDAFQEVDITGATLPFTKHSYLIKDGLDIPRVVNEAFHIANTGRPGPVQSCFYRRTLWGYCHPLAQRTPAYPAETVYLHEPEWIDTSARR